MGVLILFWFCLVWFSLREVSYAFLCILCFLKSPFRFATGLSKKLFLQFLKGTFICPADQSQIILNNKKSLKNLISLLWVLFFKNGNKLKPEEYYQNLVVYLH